MSTNPVWDEAVKQHWLLRDEQDKKNKASKRADAGTRGSVTGGKHLAPLEEAVAGLFRADPDIGAKLTILYGGKHTLPGYYRRSKNWDLVVLYRGVLVAAVEFKSQVGSIGNNHNNRTEESLGNSADLLRANELGMFGEVNPWIAYILVLEKSDKSTKPVRDDRTLFPSDRDFDRVAYLDRYRITFKRMLLEGKYNAVVVAASEKGGGVFDEPEVQLSFANFEAEVAGRLAKIKTLPDASFPHP